MVDISDISDDDSGSKKGKKKKKKGGGGKGKEKTPDGSDVGPFSLDESGKTQPDDVEIATKSKTWAENGELNHNLGASSLGPYKKKQLKETKELHGEIVEMAEENKGRLDEFTLVMHACLMNLAQNRVGIAQHISDKFGKSEKKSIKMSHKICREAGEAKVIEKVVTILSDEMMEV